MFDTNSKLGQHVQEQKALLIEAQRIAADAQDIKTLQNLIDTMTKRLTITEGLRAVAIGDSTTMGNTKDIAGNAAQVGGSYTFYPPYVGMERAGTSSWFTFLCLFSKGKLVLQHNAGVSGDKTDGMLARFMNDVVAFHPHIVFIGDARNDFAAASGITEAQTRANIISMVQLAAQNQIIPILRLNYPELNASIGAKVRRHNTWLKKYALDNGLFCVDTYSPVVDPASASGGFVTGYSDDGTHANAIGAKVAGLAVLDQMKTLLNGVTDKAGRWLPSDNMRDSNLIYNGLFQNDSNADGTADSWTVVGTTKTIETDATIKGKIQKNVISSGTGRISQELPVDGTNIHAGDVLKWSGLVKLDAASGSLATMVHMYSAGYQAANDVYAITNNTAPVQDYDWVTFEIDFKVPTGATAVRMYAESLSGTGTIQLARQSLTNLTTL